MRRRLILWAAVFVIVLAAVGVIDDAMRAGGAQERPAAAAEALRRLATVRVVDERPAADGSYDRSLFGASWSDGVAVTGGGNGCDTRNDVLRRDLTDITVRAVESCPDAVATGELRSPYTGDFVAFSRERAATAVQIDHIVPLAYAHAMGAARWTPIRRLRFANDPANLVAVDGRSNQDKGDGEPARWMPPNRAFHCAYAVQFVTVTAAYGLDLDTASRDVLVSALRRCG